MYSEEQPLRCSSLQFPVQQPSHRSTSLPQRESQYRKHHNPQGLFSVRYPAHISRGCLVHPHPMVTAHYNSLCHTTPQQPRRRATRWRGLLHSRATRFTAGEIQPLRNNTRERSDEQAVVNGDRKPSFYLLK